MSSYTFNVSTQPMAEKMDGVSTSVATVGGAIAAMQTAVIASERKAAQTICNSIDSGFLMLLRSRFSEKIARLQSAMNARVGSMLETSKAIDRTHVQMEGDFQRIKARYLKIFGSLDRNLEERIREIDGEAMYVSSQRTKLMQSICMEAPTALFCTTDVSELTLKASGARVKAKALSSVQSLGIGAHRVISYETMTRDIMDKNAPAASSLSFVPVVYASKESMTAKGEYLFDVQTPEGLSQETSDAITHTMQQNMEQLPSSNPAQTSSIRKELLQRVQREEANPRVRDTIIRLFDESFGGRPPLRPQATTRGTHMGGGIA